MYQECHPMVRIAQVMAFTPTIKLRIDLALPSAPSTPPRHPFLGTDLIN